MMTTLILTSLLNMIQNIMSAGYAVKIYGATIEETGKPYSYSSEEEDKWCNAIAEELGDYRNEN